ncbi:MAG: hypothetical protein JNL28_17375 [Planctomycetes bacterium]|nr:hypothetical protein [Planctomycetota bacterium]
MRLTFLCTFALALTTSVRAQGTILFQDDFESGLSNWSTINTSPWAGLPSIWHIQNAADVCSATPFPSGTHAAWFGHAYTNFQGQLLCGFGHSDGWSWNDGVLQQTATIALPVTNGSIRLSFRTLSEAEDDLFWDQRRVHVFQDGAGYQAFEFTPTTMLGKLVSSGWRTAVYDLTRFAGHDVRIAFEFWAGDSGYNDLLGWFIDDVKIEVVDEPALVFCAGDGQMQWCPCGNSGDAGRGCANSFDARGGKLAAAGTPSLTADTLTLTATEVSPAVMTLFAAPTAGPFGGLDHFGDGVRCIYSNIVRITGYPANGMVQVPASGGANLSTQMLVSTPGSQRFIQGLYRDAPNFCTSATFNVTNGLMLTWRP